MSSSITIVPKLKISEKGIFDMDEVYKMVKYWLDFEGYGDEEKSFKEEKYLEKIQGDTKQIEIRWRGEKIINEYVSYVITITYLVLGLTDVEIEKEGRKIKVNKGQVNINITSKIILDRQNKWKSDFFRKIYEKSILKDRIEEHKIDLYNKTYSLINEIKAYFDMNR